MRQRVVWFSVPAYHRSLLSQLLHYMRSRWSKWRRCWGRRFFWIVVKYASVFTTSHLSV